MANIYIAKDKDRLDKIVHDHYGNTSDIEVVLKENKHLLGKMILYSGDKVILPKIEKKDIVSEGKALW